MVEVHLSKNAQKDIKKIPRYIVIKLSTWVKSLKFDGLEKTQKNKGYHDEPLKGKRKG